MNAEKSLLNRGNAELTSLAGYAGGKKAGADGKVCYHNMMGIDEYHKLGHGEVVSLKVPEDSVTKFAKEYFNLFGADGDRPDKVTFFIFLSK